MSNDAIKTFTMQLGGGIRPLAVGVGIANADPYHVDDFYSTQQTAGFTDEYRQFMEQAAPRPFLGEAIEYPKNRLESFYVLIDPAVLLAGSKGEVAKEDKARRLSKSSAKYQRAGFIGLSAIAALKISDIVFNAIPEQSRADLANGDYLARFGPEELALTFRKQAARLAKSIAIGKKGKDYVVELPVIEEELGSLIAVNKRKNLMFDANLQADINAIDALKHMGLRVGNPGRTSCFVNVRHFTEFLDNAPNESKPILKTLIRNHYFQGIRYEVTYGSDENARSNGLLNKLMREQEGGVDITDAIIGDKSTYNLLNQPQYGEELENPVPNKGTTQSSPSSVIHELGDRTITGYARFIIPADEIAYFTQTPVDKIRPSYVHFFFANYYMRGATRFPSKIKTKGTKMRDNDAKLLRVRNKARDAFGAARFISPLSRILSASTSFEQRPRTNEFHLCVNQDNTQYFIPPVNKIAQYEDDMDKLLEDEDGMYRTWQKGFDQSSFTSGSWNLTIKTLSKSKAFTPNKIIYTDWVNNKLIYINSEGVMDSLDLEMAYKLRPVSILGFLNAQPEPYQMGLLSTEASINLIATKWLTKRGLMFGDYMKQFRVEIAEQYNQLAIPKMAGEELLRYLANENMDGTLSFKTYWNALTVFFNKFPVQSMAEGASFTYQEFTKESFFACVRPIGKLLEDIAWDALQDPVGFMENLGYDIPTASIMFARFLIIAKYAGQYRQVYNEVYNTQEKYRSTERSYKPGEFQPAFHCISDKAMSPHQVKASYWLNDTPEFAVLAIDAGGGKTLMAISNILKEIEKGNVHRPLVVCPSYLVKDYVSECAYFTECKVNAVVIDNSTLRNLGHDKIRQLVNSAPANTIYITAYNTLTVGQEVVNYAGSEFILGEHINFLRSLNFDGVWFDESHFLKARNSRRSIAARYLSSEIPLKRLMTGTFMPNRPFDLVKQFSFFYPGVFGSVEQFKDAFMDGRQMKPGASIQVGQMLHSNCQFIHIRRVEWLATLPPKRETLHPVELSEKQKYVYRAIFDETIRKIAEDKDLMKALSVSGSALSDEDEDDAEINANGDEEDTDAGDEVDADEPEMFDKLDKHLTAIESFLANPKANAWSKQFQLSDEELVSPKGLKIAEIAQEHIEQGIYGKILVATNWAASRDGIYESLPAWLKKRTLVYHAKNKMSDIDNFRKDPNIIMMIGIGKSLETGHNFQFCSRLIRSENVWDPGTFEQFLARAFRPSLKEKDMRKPENGGKGVFIDTIVADDTIDVLKAAKLISKTIILAKIYNHDNPNYQTLPEIPEVACSFENLKNFSSWEALEEYAEARRMLLAIERAEAQKWREEHPDEIDPVPIKDLGLLPKSALIKNTPYTPGMNIYNADELGLKPLNYYLSKELERDPNFDPVGLPVHTMYGDGTIHRVNEGSVAVYLTAEGKVTRGLNRDSVFVITRKTSDVKDIKSRIVDFAKGKGITKIVDIPFDAPIAARGNKGAERLALKEQKALERQRMREEKYKAKEDKRVQKEATKIRNLKSRPTPLQEIDLGSPLNGYIEVVNRTLCLVINDVTPDDEVAADLIREHGFHYTRPYIFAHIKTKAGFENFLDVIDQYTYDKEGNPVKKPASKIIFWTKDSLYNTLVNLYDEFTFSGSSRKLVVEQKTKTELTDFLRSNFRVISDPKEVRPYPIISNGQLFVCFDARVHAAQARKLKALVISGVKFGVQNGDLRAFFNSKAALKSTITALKDAGYVLGNEDEMREQFRNISFRGKLED